MTVIFSKMGGNQVTAACRKREKDVGLWKYVREKIRDWLSVFLECPKDMYDRNWKSEHRMPSLWREKGIAGILKSFCPLLKK